MGSQRTALPVGLLRTGLVLLGVASALAIGEVIIRRGVIPPVRQVVRGNDARLVDGVPLWTDNTVPESRQNLGCVKQHPERIRILFTGTSITFSGPVRLDETFPMVLEAELNRLRPVPGFCVMNFSQPAFEFDQRYVVAEHALREYHPQIVLDQDWLAWAAGPGIKFATLGDAIFSLDGLNRRADGFPGIRGVPDWLNKPLFLHSRLYEWATLAQGEPEHPHPVVDPFPTDEGFVPTPGWDAAWGDPRYHEHQLIKYASMVRSHGARPGFYLVVNWTYPLNETSPHDKAWADMDLALGKKDGFPVLPLRPLLADQDNTKLRRDSWHMNADGNRVVGKVLVPFVLGILDQP